MKDEKVSYFKLFGLEFPVYHARLFKLTILVYLSLVTICVLAIRFFGYEMTDADIPGGFIAGFLLSYLISIL